MGPVARGRRPGRAANGAMNKLEAEYGLHLTSRIAAGEIVGFWFEAVKLRLADKTFYTPDFLVLKGDMELEIHEVKGHWEDDARVKIKVAAEQLPFKFVAVTRKPKKAGGGWQFEQFI